MTDVPPPDEVAAFGDLVDQLAQAMAAQDLTPAQRAKLNAATRSIARGRALLAGIDPDAEPPPT
jgi:hypothetical protein